MELHQEVGPARTTISAVAERAGVERHTVYRHFPDERSLLQACSSHWLSFHPPPDLTRALSLADPVDRLRAVLLDLYDYYGTTEQMTANILRDAESMPDLREVASGAVGRVARLADALTSGWGLSGARRSRLRAAIGHALAFDTWRSLVRREGLSDAHAVELVVKLVEAAAAPSRQRTAAPSARAGTSSPS